MILIIITHIMLSTILCRCIYVYAMRSRIALCVAKGGKEHLNMF